MSNPKVYVGKTLFLEHEIRDSQERVMTPFGTTWASGTPAVATVGGQTGNGIFVTGVTPGTATITATNGTDSGSIDVDVIALPAAQVRKIYVRVGKDRPNSQ